MVEFSYSDRNDNTGGTVTITGSAGGSANTLYVSRFQGTHRNRPFEIAGTRTGNGTISVSGESGPFLAYVLNVAGSTVTTSIPKCFRIGDGIRSLHERIVDSVREFILGLALPGVTADPDLHLKAKVGAKLKEVLNGNPDCVYYLPAAETFGVGDNSFDTVLYPVNVVFNRMSGHGLVEGLSNLLKSRELAGQAFSGSPLPDVPEVHTLEIRPGIVIDPSRWELNYDASMMTFVGVSEQAAGIF
jgi:hypothetical protein